MAEPPRFDLELPGCTPEPLMAYLKALGALRLVSEQKDPAARGWWKNDVFWLRSNLDRDALVKFFLEEYKPTPIVAPWGARSGFYSGSSEKTARSALETIAKSNSGRLEPFRQAIGRVRALLKNAGIDDKASDEKKLELLSHCRNQFPDELLAWLDACVVLTGDGRRFPPLLGTGGNEGSGSYVSGFAQQVVACIIKRSHDSGIQSSLFDTTGAGILDYQTPGHFSPTASRGVNATQGFEGKSATNPWDYMLCLEGSCLWASAAVRRLGLPGRGMASFPFTVNVTGAGSTTLGLVDGKKPKQAKRDIAEMWLPIWDRVLSLSEISAVLSEGRATVSSRRGTREAASGADFARAVSELGVDRGVRRFTRTAFLMRNGQSFLSIPFGRFAVIERTSVDLLREVDHWLDRFRRAAGDKTAPPRFGSAVRRIDSAIFDFCKYGGAAFFQQILVALGAAERELASAERFREDKKLKPLAGLSADWIKAADDESREYKIALALAGVRHEPDRPSEQPKIGPMRANLEQFDWQKRCPDWGEKERCVVWNSADLATNLANVLARRVMDGARAGCDRLPLASRFAAPLDAIAAFIAGDLDDARIEQLIWGLMLIDTRRRHPARAGMSQSRERQRADPNPLPREYALLKLLFLPRPLVPERSGESVKCRLACRLADGRMEGGLIIRPEPRILPLLRAGRVGEACRIAAQRLRVSGLAPMPGPLPTGVMRDDNWSEGAMDSRRAQRLAAALLIPISSKSVNCLVDLVCRGESAAAEALALAAEGETE